jgi:hypothetical protein
MRHIACITLSIAVSVGLTTQALGDGECSPLKDFRDLYQEAINAEKAGDLPLAFIAYSYASGPFGCEGPNRSAPAAKEGWKRVGLKQARETEAKGNLFANGQYKDATSPGGWRLSRYVGGSAFQWYNEVEEPAEADRVMYQYVKSRPKDKAVFETALGHYMAGAVDHPEALAEMERGAKSNAGDQRLQKTVGYLRDIQKMVIANMNEELAQEDKSFAGYQKGRAVAGQTPVEDSLGHLATARDWFKLFGDPKANRVADRAAKRGDVMMLDQRPKAYSQAMSYYDLGNLSEKLKRLTSEANKLGDAAAGRGEYAAAIDYYEIGHSLTSENEDKINRLQGLLESKNQEKAEASEKAIKEMTKDERQKKEFKKGQEDLEKELGL